MCAAAGLERSEANPTAKAIRVVRHPRQANLAGRRMLRSCHSMVLVIDALRVRRRKEGEHSRRSRVLVLTQAVRDTGEYAGNQE